LAGSSESYITLSVFAVLGGLALAGFFFLKKKRLEA
jgi:LPXTG-motif cell wall-anchored protein